MITLNYGYGQHTFIEEDILTPLKHYEKLCQISSDINEHLPTLKQYAEECESITEMGVRFACSTWAFIEGKPKKLTCIDINYDFFVPSDSLVRQACKNYSIDFKWITGDTLKIDIEPTDLLFIDTLHTYNQLFLELMKHNNNVSKYIILHDTTTFGHQDESIYKHASDIIKENSSIKKGLIQAVDDFLSENKSWSKKIVYENNNGLTILERL